VSVVPCPQCNSTDIEVRTKREAKPTRRHQGLHYDALCKGCGITLWRHGSDAECEPLVWAKPSEMWCNGCP
jgi:hypothetical protein